MREEDRREDTASARGVKTVLIDVVAAVDLGCRHDGHAEHFREEQGEDQAEPGRPEDLHARLAGWLIDSVVCGVRSPARREPVNDSAE